MRIAGWLAALCILGLLAYSLDKNGYERGLQDCRPTPSSSTR